MIFQYDFPKKNNMADFLGEPIFQKNHLEDFLG